MKSGIVAVVGRPNVGKSTLVNALVGSKVAITSTKPQTTRNIIRGVVNGPGFQLVLVDTPGIHKPRTELGGRLNGLVYGTLGTVDAVVFVLDATQPVGPGDRLIAERLIEYGARVVVAINKTDLASKTEVVGQLGTAGEWGFDAYVPVSSLRGEGLDALTEEVLRLVPEGPMLFPEGMTTDQPETLLVAEIIREKFLERLTEELPHSLMVVVDEIEDEGEGLTIVTARVLVERNSQKGIVIGRKGAMLGAAGTEARLELEKVFGSRVHLDLRVIVEPDWQSRPELLDRLGFRRDIE